MNILQQLPKPFFVLAPMDDVTDSVFRRVVAGCAPPDLYFTEFVNVDGLQSPGRPKLMKKILFTGEEQPIIAQLWGKNPENFYKTAQELVEMGFAGIDLNMGCPAKTEVKNGCCAALINNRPLALEIIKATQEGAAGRIPVSVKTRLGFNEVDLSWHELLLQQNLAMLTLHGRTRKEMSAVPAHWDLIGEVRELRDRIAPDTLFVGNGDVMDRAQGEALAEQYGLDGVMIGRGIFKDPFAFAADSPWATYTKEQRVALYTKQVSLFAATWPNRERNIATLNKFCKVYISDFDGAKELREQLMAATTTDELLTILATA
ncbi:MAG TPA: tRNA-dihydrouridine synthase [Candidatus Saccharimonadales bacterium]|nr:tRNA-dihydrouridine synthase [Candidatus Saccharimonadales bacterium]